MLGWQLLNVVSVARNGCLSQNSHSPPPAMSNASGCDGFVGRTDFADRAAQARGASGGDWKGGLPVETKEKEPQISQIRAANFRIAGFGCLGQSEACPSGRHWGTLRFAPATARLLTTRHSSLITVL